MIKSLGMMHTRDHASSAGPLLCTTNEESNPDDSIPWQNQGDSAASDNGSDHVESNHNGESDSESSSSFDSTTSTDLSDCLKRVNYDDPSESSATEKDERSDTSSLSSCTTISDSPAQALDLPQESEVTPNVMTAMTSFMQSQEAQSVMVGLGERGKILSSINWLASHVPICVLNRLSEEVRGGMRTQNSSAGTNLVAAYQTKRNDKRELQACEDDNKSDVVSDLSGTDEVNTINPAANEHVAISREDEQVVLPLDAPQVDKSMVTSDRHMVLQFNGSDKEHQFIPKESSLSGLEPRRDISLQTTVQCQNQEMIAQPKEFRQLSFRVSNNEIRSLVESMSSIDSIIDNLQTSLTINIGVSNKDSKSNGVGGSIEHISQENTNAGESVLRRGDDSDESLRYRLARRALRIGSLNTMLTHEYDTFQLGTEDEHSKGRQSPLGSVSPRTSRQQKFSSSQPKNAMTRRNDETFVLPFASKHQCALLFIDISGFTKLATTLDPESLSKAINSYFQLIVDLVVTNGGDILKFAGDAVFAEWRSHPSRNSAPQLISTTNLPLVDCVNLACVCASRIVAQCSDFPTFAHGVGGRGQGEQVATLNVHCGIGAGDLVCVHVGDYVCRREFVLLGDPIDQVAEALGGAALGEVAVSPQALAMLAESCDFHQSVLSAPAGKAVIIARRTISQFELKAKAPPKLIPNDDYGALALSSHVKVWSIEDLKQYRKLISLYAHPVVVNNDSSQSRNPTTTSGVQERHREEAELRSVYVMFITPLISTRLSGCDEADKYLINVLNNIINLTTRELNRFNGHLRQFIVDDKGLVLIATFGLRGSTFPNMVAERALPATIVIHNALQNELGVENQIGATIGNAYCGVVGGINRHEYAVLGPSVNLAARLMGSPKNPGILVDDAVRVMADRSYGFNALEPVKAKGYSDLVPIFEPLSPLERSWGRVQANFVGRKQEIKELMGIARKTAWKQCSSKLVFISGESGMGKSTMVVHGIEHIRKMMGACRGQMIVTTHVSNESNFLVPFGMFRSILIDVMRHFRSAIADDKSLVSNQTSGGLESIGWESLSDASLGVSLAASAATGTTRTADCLGSICRELNAPPAFYELVGHHLLGIDAQGAGLSKGTLKKGNKPSNLKSLVSFMAQAFQRCTQDANLIIIALDDVHFMDEMSWLVVEELFANGTGMLFVCMSRPLTTYKLSIPDEFWHTLNERHEADGRFISMKMDGLGEEDIRDMIAKTLGIQDSQISATLQRNVLAQSGGLPHLANEILDAMKRRKALDGHLRCSGDEYNTETAFTPVGEPFLHRIDSLHARVRHVLNLGAVLGSTFGLVEIVAVVQSISGEAQGNKVLCTTETRTDLDFAVQEGILYVQHECANKDGNADIAFADSWASVAVPKYGAAGHPLSDTVLSYTFCHDIWRTTILNLMLDSRKRDMNRIIAMTLESQHCKETDDFLSRMKLFTHWKASGDSIKAANLALSIGKSFEELGLQDQSVKLYNDTIEMWLNKSSKVKDGTQIMDSITSTDMECIIKIYIALGQSYATMHKGAESVDAYKTALCVLQSANCANELRDRSIVFPIFSGLFLAIKFGQVDQDEHCYYEQMLVARFVHETRLHGDPIHLARSLAMQGDMYGRLELYDKALAAKDEMVDVYNPDTMSTGICAAYGSDRCAQLFCSSILWFRALGDNEKAMDMCWYIVNELMPKMERRNVHNSSTILYPVIWMLKDNGFASEARKQFQQIVIDAFDEYYGNGRSVFALPIFDPILMLLHLAEGDEIADDISMYVEWAMNEENLRFGTVMNCAFGNFGRCPDSITVEICYLLALRLDDINIKRKLVQSGLRIAMEVAALSELKRMIHARREIDAVFNHLSTLALELSTET